MRQYTFGRQYMARTMSQGVVVVPDEVADDQKGYDGKTFPVLKWDTQARAYQRPGRAMLMGDEYGLNTPGTGDMVVKIVA